MMKGYCFYLILCGIVFGYVLTTVIPNVVTAKTLEDIVHEGESQSLPHLNVGEKPEQIEVSDHGFVYVSNRDSQSVSAIDINTMEVLEIRVEKGPSDIANYLGTVYVANTQSDSVSVINGINNTVEGTIPVGNAPVDIALGTDKIYVANAGSNSISVISTSNNTEIARIPVGDNPLNIQSQTINADTTLYVTNFDSNNLSIINGSTDMEIARIPVGKGPGAIATFIDRVYVLNAGNVPQNGTVSVIDTNTKTEMEKISVGLNPVDLVISGDNLYVANYDYVSVINLLNNKEIVRIPVEGSPTDISSDYLYDKISEVDKVYTAIDMPGNFPGYVSVIETENNKVIQKIPVGIWPNFIAIDGDLVYVSNFDSNSVTVFSGRTLKVQAGVSFDVIPSHAGRVVCGISTVPINVHFYTDYNTRCVVESNKGFQFISWMQILGPNSSRIISVPQNSDSLWDKVWNNLDFKSNGASSDLDVTQFANFAANFEKLPSPIPDEYLIPLYGIIISSIIGWSIPSIVGGIKTKRQQGKLYSIHLEIDKIWNDGRLDFGDIKTLDGVTIATDDAYAKGKLNTERYMNLKRETSVLYEEIFKKRIDMLNNLIIKHNSKDDRLLSEIKYEINDAYAKGKLIEVHYDLLKEMISEYEDNK